MPYVVVLCGVVLWYVLCRRVVCYVVTRRGVALHCDVWCCIARCCVI